MAVNVYRWHIPRSKPTGHLPNSGELSRGHALCRCLHKTAGDSHTEPPTRGHKSR